MQSTAKFFSYFEYKKFIEVPYFVLCFNSQGLGWNQEHHYKEQLGELTSCTPLEELILITDLFIFPGQ